MKKYLRHTQIIITIIIVVVVIIIIIIIKSNLYSAIRH